MPFRSRPAEQRERAEQRKAANLRALMAPSRALSRGTYAGGCSGVAAANGPEPLRSERHRRLVAGLPCFHCRIVGFSQAAHSNSGKAKGKKTSDAECFPLCCDRPGVIGCHFLFDQYRLVDRAGMPAFERRALAWTLEQLKENT